MRGLSMLQSIGFWLLSLRHDSYPSFLDPNRDPNQNV